MISLIVIAIIVCTIIGGGAIIGVYIGGRKEVPTP